MILKLAIILFALSGLIVAIIPFLHSMNRDKIFAANFYDEDYSYEKASKIKRILDVFFISNLIIMSMSLSYCLSCLLIKF